MKKIALVFLVLSLLFGFTKTTSASTKTWDVDTAITAPDITSPSADTYVEWGTGVSCTVGECTDQDHYVTDDDPPEEDYPSDNLTYTWSDGGAGGNFLPETGTSVTYTAPDTAQDVTIKVTVTDEAAMTGCGDEGTRDDTDVEDTVDIKVVKPEISPSTSSINDGQSAGSFSVIDDNDATAWAWSYEVPSGSGNNPNVDFNPSDGDPTSTSAEWFAYPDNEYWAWSTSTYTLKCIVTFPGLEIDAQTADLSILVPWDPGGRTYACFVAGVPEYDTRQVEGETEWYVKDLGSLYRGGPTKYVYVPQSSQFYDKVNAHETKHVEQWESGMAKDIFTLEGFYSLIENFTSMVDQADLEQQVSDEKEGYDSAEAADFLDIKDAMEEEAYGISDPINPQYIYQS